MTQSQQELRWKKIEATRKIDKSTGMPEIGSHGKAFLRWHNNMIDRVLVMHRDDQWKVTVMRLQGGQQMVVPIDSLRTLDEVLESVKASFPEFYPASAQARAEINPATLPTGVINRIWGVA